MNMELMKRDSYGLGIHSEIVGIYDSQRASGYRTMKINSFLFHVVVSAAGAQNPIEKAKILKAPGKRLMVPDLRFSLPAPLKSKKQS